MNRSTDLARAMVPRGTVPFFPELAARKRTVEARLWDTFSRWGYREIIPPLFEYLDVLSQGLAPETVAAGYKLEDRQDGRLMVLRPDVTAQVARMAAARRDNPATPHRYAYQTGVFSHTDAHRGRPREVFQAGVELLGPGGYSADAEVLALLITALRDLGLDDFIVSTGQARYFKAILGDLGLSDGVGAELTRAMGRKDVPSIRAILAAAGVDAAKADRVARIPLLIGGREVLETARGLTKCADALAALDHLEKVAEALDSCGLGRHLSMDLGEVRDMDYYTGVVFDVLAPGMGIELGGGGRYDDLLGRFGHPMPAIGFALDVERVLEAIGRAGVPLAAEGPLFRVSGTLPDAHRAAAALRARGLNAVVALKNDTGGTALEAQGERLFRVSAQGRQPVDVETLVSEA
ncbi:MAG: ATP phosphoribosyltransferase regulatory subunit [Nitrospirota bacterium]|nr:ATP phosphoribosyltransferase regulatory subunit [Nitrospirota bacterium]